MFRRSTSQIVQQTKGTENSYKTLYNKYITKYSYKMASQIPVN